MIGMKEIDKLIIDIIHGIGEGEQIDTNMVVNSVHEAIYNDTENTALYIDAVLLNGLHIRTNKVFNSIRKKESKTDISQSEFRAAGFTFIKEWYPVHVGDGTIKQVPTNDMTEVMFDEQILLHEKAGHGHFLHAGELKQLKRMKFGVAANDPEFFDIDHDET